MNAVTLLMAAPFCILTIWYLADKSERQNMLDEIASKVGPYHFDTTKATEEILNDKSYQYSFTMIMDYLEKKLMRDRSSAVRYFDDIHSMFKHIFIMVSILVITIYCFFQEFTDIKTTILTIVLYLLIWLANLVYGYSSKSSKIIWLFLGLLCFAFSFGV